VVKVIEKSMKEIKKVHERARLPFQIYVTTQRLVVEGMKIGEVERSEELGSGKAG
jgi:hypothetical protein